jgi:cyclophilin family peptidyl-prolyl cis-trans isomerase
MRSVVLALLVGLIVVPGFAQTKPVRSKAKTKAKAKPAPVQAVVEEPKPVATPEPAPAPKPKPRVRVDTSYGPITLELEPDLAPKTVENFLGYVKDGHYKGTIFHRVIPGFMIQGGGNAEDMGEKTTRAPILNEAPATFKAGLKNTLGTMAMARTSEPHSATAQFYINLADNPNLDFKSETPDGYGYCAFGRVVEGMEAVLKIEKVRTVWRRGMKDVPEYAVRILNAELLP